ncbi:MAG: DUF996 domain-containing protein [Candidatus Bathyarchaeota archaeon]|nr:DUF996 domain-containing protein [Candidatus Bathyarchaeota archaeon]
MSSVESSKILAGIGTVLLIFSAAPVVGIIGIILLLIGLKGLSEYYRDDTIYQNAVRGVIFGVIAIIALSARLIGTALTGVLSGISSGSLIRAGLGTLALLAVIAVIFVFFLLMALNFRRCFYALANHTGEQLFRTAGTLLFVGAILTIVFIGLLFIFIAWLIAAIAFFTMKLPYAYGPPTPTAMPPPAQGTRFCPNCGAPVDATAVFCPRCGRQLPPP